MICCPVCKSDIFDDYLSINNYNVTKCSSCGLVFSFPLPTEHELKMFYQGFVFEKPSDKNLETDVLKAKFELQRLFKFKDDFEKKLFLDYGGGTGVTWKAAKDIGFDSYYFDIDNEAENFVKNAYGLTEENIFYFEKKSNLKFDYILCDNVIEHVPNPDDLILQLYNLLNKGGKLILKTPRASNSETLFTPTVIYMYFKKALRQNSLFKSLRFLFSKRFYHCEPPRHIYSFTDKSIKILIENTLNYEKFNFLIESYHNHVFKYSMINIIWSKFSGVLRIVILFLFFPIFVIELMIIFIKNFLLKLKLINYSGLIAIIEKLE